MEASQSVSLRTLHRNNNAKSRGRNVTFENLNNAEAEQRLAEKMVKIEKKLMDPANMRLFTAENLLPRPHWEKVMKYDDTHVFAKRDPPPKNATDEQKAQYEFAVALGQNIARWHQENKPVVVEYLLFLKDENLNMLKPQYSAIIRKCSRKTKCYILITNRILNRQVGKFKWIKYLIVQIQGPDYTMVKVCNTMLERWFPEYRKRVEYNKQRYKFGIFTSETTVDNADLYFPYQRSGKCATNFGDLPCETPYGASEKQNALGAPWKANNRMFMEGNLLPSNTAVKTAQSYVYAYHPLGARDRFEFRSMFGLKEPPANFELREDIGYPTSNLCGPDFAGHPKYYDKGVGEDSIIEGMKSEDEEENPDFVDPEHLILDDEDEKAAFKAMKMQFIMDKRLKFIHGTDPLAVPFPQALIPTGALNEDAQTGGDKTHHDLSLKKAKKAKLESVGRKLILINEDNIYLEYCFERDHLKRNPISPYPRSLVPGKELADQTKPAKVTINPIKCSRLVDRRDELMRRFQLLIQGTQESGAAAETASPFRRSSTASLGGAGGGGGGGRKQKEDKTMREDQAKAPAEIPKGVTFAMFKAKVEGDAKKRGMKRSNLFGKNKLNQQSVISIIPEWRRLAEAKENIYETVKHKVRIYEALMKRGPPKDRLMKHDNRVLDDINWPENHTVTLVSGPVRKPKVTPKMPLYEGGTEKTAAVVEELMKLYSSEKTSLHHCNMKKTGKK